MSEDKMHTIDENLKTDTLIVALVHREREVFDYQINIDNYRMAIDTAGDDSDLAEMAGRIRKLLVTETREQKNAQLMLTVIEKQLVDAGVDVAKLAKAKAAEMEAAAALEA